MMLYHSALVIDEPLYIIPAKMVAEVLGVKVVHLTFVSQLECDEGTTRMTANKADAVCMVLPWGPVICWELILHGDSFHRNVYIYATHHNKDGFCRMMDFTRQPSGFGPRFVGRRRTCADKAHTIAWRYKCKKHLQIDA